MGKLGWTIAMRRITKPWTISSILLAAAGSTLVMTGLYFILLRPPLLPEDVRFMALPAAQFDAVKPALESWLAHVFQVMGGYVFATGVLTITLAATAFRAHHWAAAAGALIGGTASIGWMAYVNFVINSDFKRVLLGTALLWGSSLVLFVIEKTNLQQPSAQS